MTNTERIFKTAVKDLSKQWGYGWNYLGDDLRHALVKAKVLGVISWQTTENTDPAAYMAFVSYLADRAARWDGTP